MGFRDNSLCLSLLLYEMVSLFWLKPTILSVLQEVVREREKKLVRTLLIKLQESLL